MSKILCMAATLCFLLAAFGVGFSAVAIIPLGLALWAGSELV